MHQHLLQRVFGGKPQPGRTKGFGGFHAEITHKIGGFDALIPRIAADFGMQGGGFAVAQFTHIAHHENARRRQPGQHIQRGLHAVGVGVVGVVDNRAAAQAGFALQTAFDVGKPGQRDGAFR